jgi:hypothetical protein
MRPYGIGVEGDLGPEGVAALAALAEECGYGHFWFNVTSTGIDHIHTLQLACERTRAFDIGTGVFPLDGFPANQMVKALKARDIPLARTIIGIGSGQVRQGALRIVEDAAATLRTAVPGCRIAVGAIGRNMLRLGGRIADALVLNWLTPERLAWAGEQLAAEETHGRRRPAVYLYHRAALGPTAVARIQAEMERYRQYPHHQRHQAAMGSPPLIGVAAQTVDDIEPDLAPYRMVCDLVLRPLPNNRRDLGEWESLVRFFAPRNTSPKG